MGSCVRCSSPSADPVKLAERVVLLFTRGDPIGRRVALRLAEEGASIVLAVNDEERGERLTAELEAANAEASLVVVDRRDPGLVQAAISEAVMSFGALDGLVILPEPSPPGDVGEIDLAAWSATEESNVRASWLAAAAAMPFLKQNPGASIVIATQDAERTLGPRQVLEATRDAALSGLVRSLAIDAGPHDVRVNAIALGYIETESTRRDLETASDPETAFEREMAVQPLGRFGRPRDVAHAVIFLLSDESAYITGATLPLDGGRGLVRRGLFG